VETPPGLPGTQLCQAELCRHNPASISGNHEFLRRVNDEYARGGIRPGHVGIGLGIGVALRARGWSLKGFELFSEESGARRSSGPDRLCVSRVSATPPNPAWRPKQPSLWPHTPPTLHHGTLAGHSPEPRRSTSDRQSEVLRRGSGECPVGPRSCEQAVEDDVPPVLPKTEKNRGMHHKCLSRRSLSALHGSLARAPPGCHRSNAIAAHGK
jgi:hypothetical protein